MWTSSRLNILAFAAACTNAPALAQSFDTTLLKADSTEQATGVIGAAVAHMPVYSGADQQRLKALPLLEYQSKEGWFAGTLHGVGYNASSDPAFQYGPRITADLGRKANQSESLHGMGDVSPKVEWGAFFNYLLSDSLGLTSSIRYGSGDGSTGVVSSLGITYAHVLSTQWLWCVEGGLTFANRSHMQTYFGVTTEQSSSSGHAPYKPRPGLRDARIGSSLSYQVDRRTFINTSLSIVQIGVVARRSPLELREVSVIPGIAVGYRF
ncbi:MAG TPA: MipA/OmpV family protein [Aquabacterium sp.]|nr:MipA/OmpV family protein [Aquabacterium sp.]